VCVLSGLHVLGRYTTKSMFISFFYNKKTKKKVIIVNSSNKYKNTIEYDSLSLCFLFNKSKKTL